MTIEVQSRTAIDYRPCRYGPSRLSFRGPARPLGGAYLAALGGSETFGKFVTAPYADLLERSIRIPVVNLGVMQAGLTLLLDDPGLLTVAAVELISSVASAVWWTKPVCVTSRPPMLVAVAMMSPG